MNYFKTVIFLVFILHIVSCSEYISTRVFVYGTGVLISSFFICIHVNLSWQEYCDQSWENFNAKTFESYLQDHLYGQHLVTWTVPQALKAHIFKDQPSKALVISFHGWTGSGKNYVSKIIADVLYEKGSKSDFVHWYIATRDFPHSTDAKQYHDKLHREIPEYTRRCEKSLFIFDEMDKMGPGIIDAIKPYIDFYEDIDGIDYRKNIFIFLSNAGGSEITRVALNFWADGKDREDITMKDIEPLVNKGAFNDVGGLQYSEIVKKNLIDMYVPFLPLERSHVRKCIASELKKRNQKVKKHVVDKVIHQLVFYPRQFELYSVSGCKKVSHKVDLFGIQN